MNDFVDSHDIPMCISKTIQQSTKNDYRNVSNTVSFNVRIKVARPFIGGRVNEDLLKGGVLKS
jgi:hypothetical protein